MLLKKVPLYLALIVASTFSQFIFFFYSALISRTVKKTPLLISHLIIICALSSYLSLSLYYFGWNSGIAELKIFLSLSVLYFSSKHIRSSFAADDFIVSFIIFSIILLIIYSSFGEVRASRFIDAVPFFTHYLSTYFGLSAAFLLSIARAKYIFWLMLFILLNGSGSPLIVSVVILFVRFYKFVFKPFHLFAALTVGLLSTVSFFSGQTDRGRDLSDFATVDRVILSSAGIDLARSQSATTTIFGRIPGEAIGLDHFIDDDSVRNYVLAENDGLIYPRILHNDFLRIYFNFGIFGLFIFMYSLVSAIKNISLLYGVLIASLFSSVVYVTPLIFIIYVINISSNIRK